MTNRRLALALGALFVLGTGALVLAALLRGSLIL